MGSSIPPEEARNETRRILRTYGLLMALLLMTMAVTTVDLGWGNAVANLSIAVIKALLIVWVFMHLREATPRLRLFAAGAVLWFGLLVIFGLGDWVTRGQ